MEMSTAVKASSSKSTTGDASEAIAAVSSLSSSPSTTTPAASACSSAKVGRKKFKKLKKRAMQIDTNGPKSGLLTRQEWVEYKSLLQGDITDDAATAMAIGPLIQLRQSAKKNGNNAASNSLISEGVHHRDLLSWLLLVRSNITDATTSKSSSKSKKRKLDCQEIDDADRNGDDDRSTNDNPDSRQQSYHPMDSAASVPFWASIHNPGTVQNVAVLEIHTTKQILDKYVSLHHGPSSSEKPSALGGVRSTIGIQTKWFQGSIPKSMTDCLLYFSKSGDKQEKRKKTAEIKRQLADSSSIPSLSKIVQLLQPLVLSEDDLREEGYPISSSSSPSRCQLETMYQSESVGFNCPQTSQLPADVDPVLAEEFVKKVGVRVEEQDDDDRQPYVWTKPSMSSRPPNGSHPRVFAVDCEMVLTTSGLELARVTVLQFHGLETKVDGEEKSKMIASNTVLKTTTILDCLVRPKNAIMDYLTRHSGVTAKMLENVTTNISQVQFFLANFVEQTDILIGHSLENDLKALHLIHETVVDTSLVYRPSQRRFKISLRHLSSTILKRDIQTGQDGHCSEEDAIAALELAVLKAWLGDLIQIPGYGGEKDRRRSLLQHHAACSTNKNDDNDNTSAFIGPSSWIQEHVTNHPNTAHALPYERVEDCSKAIKAFMSSSSSRTKPTLVWGSVSMSNLGRYNDGSDDKDQQIESRSNAIDTLVKDIAITIPPSSVLMVSLQADFQKSVEKNRQRQACQDARSTVGWSIKQEEDWQSTLEVTRNGYVVWISALGNA